jgi:hypothetical protein
MAPKNLRGGAKKGATGNAFGADVHGKKFRTCGN